MISTMNSNAENYVATADTVEGYGIYVARTADLAKAQEFFGLWKLGSAGQLHVKIVDGQGEVVAEHLPELADEDI